MGDAGSFPSEVDRYHLIERIGHGSFGTVWKGFDSIAGREVAVKVVELEEIEDDIAEIQEEIAALKTCRSPHIVQYYGCHVVPGTSQLRIVMELMAASAADLAAPEDGPGGTPPPPPAISEASIAYIIRQVLKALVYLHSAGRLHRDVKAANVLLSSRGEVKVSDFGVSAQLSGTVGYKRRTFVGSPLWMAPEVIEQSPEARSMPGGTPRDPDVDPDAGYDTAADIWSLGIAAIELAKGEPPRAHVTSFRLLFMIVRDEPPSLDGADFSTEFRDFVWQCLRKNPAERPTALDLLLHPFVVGADVPPPELPQAVAACLQRQRLAAARARRQTLTSPAPPGAPGEGMGPATRGPLGEPPVQALPATGPPLAGTQAEGGLPRSPTDGTPRWNFSLLRQASVGTADGAAVAPSAPSSTWRRPGAPVAALALPSPPLAASPPPASMATGSPPAAAGPPSPTTNDGYSYGPTGARGAPGPDAPAPADGQGVRRRGTATDNGSEGLTRSAVRFDTTAATASAALGRVLRPALQGAAATPEGAAASEDVFAALVELENAQPGAAQALVGEIVVALSASAEPELRPLRQAALVAFAGGGAGPTGDALPTLGPLGGFLLARWREQVVRERIQHQHQQWEN